MKILKLVSIILLFSCASAQQIPWGQPNVPVSSRDRVYAADQTSNTVSVIDPFTNKLLGVIRLGDQYPGRSARDRRLPNRNRSLIWEMGLGRPHSSVQSEIRHPESGMEYVGSRDSLRTPI